MAANLAAIETVTRLERDNAVPTQDDLEVLAKWSSWGGLGNVFDETRVEYEQARFKLHQLLSEDEYDTARASSVSAFFTPEAYSAAMWEALGGLGFESGRVIEPGCGKGTFISVAPDGAACTGIEKDVISAKIAAYLNPTAAIASDSYENIKLPNGVFDVAIGNVPFADYTPFDSLHNRDNLSLHNYFISKSIDLTRPGGITCVISSSHTLDSVTDKARQAIEKKADFLGAVRLPAGAFKDEAGTDVVTDVLLFRRRYGDAQSNSQPWLGLSTVNTNSGIGVSLNSYFANNPGHVLGQLGTRSNQYGGVSLTVTNHSDDRLVAAQLKVALSQIVSRAEANGLSYSPVEGSPEHPVEITPPDLADTRWVGQILQQDNEFVQRLSDGSYETVKVPKKYQQEVAALLQLRDAAYTLVQGDGHGANQEDHRAYTRSLYESYLKQYGPISRFDLRPSRKKADQEMGLMSQVPSPAYRIVSTDPHANVLLSIENFNEEEQVATPAPILYKPVIQLHEPIESTTDPSVALAISVGETGGIDLERITKLLGFKHHEEAIEALGDRVFMLPETEEYVTRAEYLSGNIHQKLTEAALAADEDPAFMVNVRALEAVRPSKVTADQIATPIGAPWIPTSVYADFYKGISQGYSATVSYDTGTWKVRGEAGYALDLEHALPEVSLRDLFERLLNNSSLKVFKGSGDERQIDAEATEVLQSKAVRLQDRFDDWLWRDPSRTQRLESEYNRRFNSLVLRDYTEEGKTLEFPGLSTHFVPDPHQRSAVARMLHEPATGLFHVVGAGKTAEMVMGVMEMRRLGIAHKPAMVIPNHMLAQVTREWMSMYPSAKILAASSKSLSGPRARREFIASAAMEDWDAVIFTQGAFERIPVQDETHDAYVRKETAYIRESLEYLQRVGRLESKGHFSQARLEKLLLQAETNLKRVSTVSRDHGISFEATGIDYLIVDEAHMYKNLITASSIDDAAKQGSKRATDLHMKVEYLREQKPDRPVVTFATATPIANSVSEAHIMMRYLRPDLLDEAGVKRFDEWAATFGKFTTDIEFAPEGGGRMRVRKRFAAFQNVPEMMKFFGIFADIKSAEDINLPRPLLAERASDGRRLPEMVAIPASEDVELYVQQLGERADAIRSGFVHPKQDNMLVVSMDGRKAALDMRMVDEGFPADPSSKIPVVADNIAKIWEQNKDRIYPEKFGSEELSSKPGAFQFVFCELGTPSGKSFNAYQALREELAARGMDAGMIRFMQDYQSPEAKAKLFKECTNGEVAVLIGSTQTMGVGTNAQLRAVALHHVDCPWRPADIIQRQGRMLRRGNANPEVQEFVYVTQGSYDSYMWQTCTRKAKFVDQIMRADPNQREVEEISDAVITANEARAIGLKDPRLLTQVQLEEKVGKLKRQLTMDRRKQMQLHTTVATNKRDIEETKAKLDAYRRVLPTVTNTEGEAFNGMVNGRPFTSRSDFAAALKSEIQSRRSQLRFSGQTPHDIGLPIRVGGTDYTVSTLITQLGTTIKFSPLGESVASVSMEYAKLRETSNSAALGMVRRLENSLRSVEATIPLLEERAAKLLTETTELEARLNDISIDDSELRHAETELAELNYQIEHEAPPEEVMRNQYDQAMETLEIGEETKMPTPNTTPEDVKQPYRFNTPEATQIAAGKRLPMYEMLEYVRSIDVCGPFFQNKAAAEKSNAYEVQFPDNGSPLPLRKLPTADSSLPDLLGFNSALETIREVWFNPTDLDEPANRGWFNACDVLYDPKLERGTMTWRLEDNSAYVARFAAPDRVPFLESLEFVDQHWRLQSINDEPALLTFRENGQETRQWYTNGVIHRRGAPALERIDNQGGIQPAYYVNGNFVEQNEAFTATEVPSAELPEPTEEEIIKAVVLKKLNQDLYQNREPGMEM